MPTWMRDVTGALSTCINSGSSHSAYPQGKQRLRKRNPTHDTTIDFEIFEYAHLDLTRDTRVE